MSQMMRDRIAARLSDLGLGPGSNETKDRLKREGLSAVYLHDFLSGKTNQPRAKNLEALARALDCSVDFLTGQVGNELGGAEIEGVCEVGSRKQSVMKMKMTVGIQPEPDFPWNRQSVFLVRGEEYTRFGIPDGAVVVIADGVAPNANDRVVARFRSIGGELETTIMVCFDKANFIKPESDQTIQVKDGFEVIGKILKVYPSF